MGFDGEACENDRMEGRAHACPCCGHLTLHERAGFEICAVCSWEDDGQDDVDAHLDRGGPNHGTLWAARTRFLTSGAAADEPPVRRWSLLDDVAVELIPSSNVAPWLLLHDGLVTDIERGTDRVTLVVDARYVRARFSIPGSAFRIELLDCSHLEYAPYEGAATSSPSEIVKASPDIVEAKHDGGNLVLWGSSGVLRLRYRDLALRFDDGTPLALAALDACARAYWEAWDRDVRQRRP
jgi:hypothetical protein